MNTGLARTSGVRASGTPGLRARPRPEGPLNVPGQVTVEITQGNTGFGNFDGFSFSVFKSTATGGKKNEIGLFFIDVKTGP